MPTHKRINKSHKQAVKRLRKQCHNQNKDYERLVEILGTACKYCNNLENHLKSKGYTLRMVEEIKESDPMKCKDLRN